MAGWGRIPYYSEGAQYMSLATSTDYNYAGYQCVGLVKAVTGLGSTSTWIRGDQITTTNLPNKGDIIATFSLKKGKYKYNFGHTAVVWSADNDKITVIDQNWEEGNLQVGGKIIKHVITFGGSSINNASNYYHVKYNN